MSKRLIVTNSKKCIGCELCVFQAQTEARKVGLEGSPIRILREMKDKLQYVVDIDPSINKLNIEKIKASCPKAVLDITESEKSYDET